MKNSTFIFFTLSLTGYLYQIIGLQFWLTDYAQTFLKIQPSKIYLYLSVVMVVFPIIGVLTSSFVTKKVRGASAPQALGILCLAAFFSTVVSLPIPFVRDFQPFLIMITLLIIFISFIIPLLMS